MAHRALFCSSIVLFLAAAAAAAPPQGRDTVSVCHFAENGQARLLSISASALPAHLAHGDVQAPPSVRSSADCLIPQPPPAPVAATASTDASGIASFVIPNTNVIARISARDSAGAPVSGATAQIMVIGNDYLATVTDPGRRVAPASVEGRLTDARPGSALQLIVNAVMRAFTSTFPNGSTLTTMTSFPSFVRSHFSPDERCFTQAEYTTFLENACSATADTATGIATGLYFTLVSQVVVQAAEQLASVITGDVCARSASEAATIMFTGKTLPVNVRVYNPPLLPGVKIYPVYFENLGSCGGACCVAQGLQCELVSRAGACGTGRYLADTPCSPDNPCRTGACCDPRTGCRLDAEIPCRNAGGTYHGDGTTCSRVNPQPGQPLVFNLVSGGGAGGASFPIPVTHGTIKTTVTVPGNIINGQCQRDWRIEICVRPFNAGCAGGHIYAGQQFSICHANPETITFEQMNPPSPCSYYSINALTAGVSQVVVEIKP